MTGTNFNYDCIREPELLQVIKLIDTAITTALGVTNVTCTSTEINQLTGSLPAQPVAGKVAVFDANKKLNLARLGSGAASASGLLMGVGTSIAPTLTTTADANMIEIRSKNTATSGTSRLAYYRHDIGGAGQSGESFRSYTDLTAAASTAHGAHISLQAGATGYCTGEGIGVRSQLFVKNEAIATNGTYFAGQSEIWSDGSSSSLSAVTKHAIHSFAATGNATGMATVINALSFDGTAASGVTSMISSTSLAELPVSTVGIACLVNGTRYYIPAVIATQWN